MGLKKRASRRSRLMPTTLTLSSMTVPVSASIVVRYLTEGQAGPSARVSTVCVAFLSKRFHSERWQPPGKGVTAHVTHPAQASKLALQTIPSVLHSDLGKTDASPVAAAQGTIPTTPGALFETVPVLFRKCRGTARDELSARPQQPGCPRHSGALASCLKMHLSPNVQFPAFH